MATLLVSNLSSKISILPLSFSLSTSTKPLTNLPFTSTGTGTFQPIECSSRPQKKATAHHRKTRPRKSAPWDIRRGPAVYPPLPQMPAEWSFVPKGVDEDAAAKDEALVDPVAV